MNKKWTKNKYVTHKQTTTEYVYKTKRKEKDSTKYVKNLI